MSNRVTTIPDRANSTSKGAARRLRTFSSSWFLATTSTDFWLSSPRILSSCAGEYRQCRNWEDSWYADGPGTRGAVDGPAMGSASRAMVATGDAGSV